MVRVCFSTLLGGVALAGLLVASAAPIFAQCFSGTAFPTDLQPYGLDVADYTGDGILDLVVAHAGADSVFVLEGDGQGGFNRRCNAVYLDGHTSRDVGTGSVKEDDGLDALDAIVVQPTSNGERSFCTLYGNGSCAFGGRDCSGTGKDARSVLAADFDLDGHGDWVISQNSLPAGLPVCRFDYGDGTGNAQRVEEIDVGDDPQRMAMADFDLDGDLDVAVACRGSNEVWVLLNQGGSFQPQQIMAFDSSVGLFALAAGDFNTDGRPDLAIPDTDGGLLFIAVGDGTGLFDITACSPITIPLAGRSIVAAHLDDDGFIDLAIAHDEISQLTILEGDGSCGFTIAEQVTDGLAEPKTVVSGDFNGDGWSDLAVTNYSADNVTVFINCCRCSNDATWSNYGQGWPGTNGIPCLLSDSDPVIGSTICLTTCNSLGLPTGAFLFVGLDPADLPTPWDGHLLLQLYSVFPLLLPAGGLVLCGDIPCDSAFCGLHVYLQVLELDPGASRGVSFTPGLELLLGC